jgi:hypothetical protein
VTANRRILKTLSFIRFAQTENTSHSISVAKFITLLTNNSANGKNG